FRCWPASWRGARKQSESMWLVAPGHYSTARSPRIELRLTAVEDLEGQSTDWNDDDVLHFPVERRTPCRRLLELGDRCLAPLRHDEGFDVENVGVVANPAAGIRHPVQRAQVVVDFADEWMRLLLVEGGGAFVHQVED